MFLKHFHCNSPNRAPKQKVEEADHSTAPRNTQKKIKIAETEDEMTMKSKGVRSRASAMKKLVILWPATQGARKELTDEDDHFRVLRSHKRA